MWSPEKILITFYLMNEEVLKRDYNTNVVYTHNFSFRIMFSDVAGYLLPTTYVTGDCVKIDTFF